MSDPLPPTPASSPEHDAWLRQALRHAPDATATAPLSLREAILAEARAAASSGPRKTSLPSPVDRFAEFWSWLARPPVAAGFASVMAATLVGLMWWDRPIDETMPPPPEPVAAARKPAPQASPRTPAPAAPTPLADEATATAQAAAPVAPAEAPRPAPKAPAATAERAPAADRAEPRGIAAAPQTQPPAAFAGAPKKAKAAADALHEEREDAGPRISNAAPAAPTMPTATTAPRVPSSPTPFPAHDARQSDAQASAPARSERPALAKKAERSDAEEKRQAEVAQNKLAAATAARTTGAASMGGRLEPSSKSSTSDSVSAGRFAAAPQPAPAAGQRAAEGASTTPRPMAPLLAALSNDASRWSRSAAAGETVAAGRAAQAWLARVDAGATQWQALSGSPSRLDGRLASSADASTMLLYRDGHVAAIVRIDDAGVYFETRPAGAAWFAALAPYAVARLRATLPAATR